VWCQKKIYQTAEGVTYAGSYWFSQTDDNTEKPGTGKAWRLAVRKGRDGKDVRDEDE
jgi:hypothetical protein